MGGLSDRDRLIIDLWNSDNSIDAIGRAVHMRDSAVYEVLERRRREGHDVKVRYHHWKGDRRRRRAAKVRRAVEERGLDTSTPISVGKASSLVGLAHSTIYGAIYAGKLRAGRDGWRWQVTIADLLDWADTI